MRGSLHLGPIAMNPYGIIPAHAGLTTDYLRRLCCRGDHPRACGAHADHFLCPRKRLGSSPRMRGSLPALETGTEKQGIIPAHAGLTFSPPRGRKQRWDHPRACGAHRILISRHLQPNRIIPAHAGLTNFSILYTPFNWDHPRACGAHFQADKGYYRRMGSSPRMRGSQADLLDDALGQGIIPAHAGLTFVM